MARKPVCRACDATMTQLNAALCGRILFHMRDGEWHPTVDVAKAVLAALPRDMGDVSREVVALRVQSLGKYGLFQRKGGGGWAKIRLSATDSVARTACMLVLRASGQPMLLRDIAECLGVRPRAISSVLKGMQHHGEVESQGKSPALRWSLTGDVVRPHSTTPEATPEKPKNLPRAGKSKAGGDPMVRWAAGRLGRDPDAYAALLRGLDRDHQHVELVRAALAA